MRDTTLIPAGWFAPELVTTRADYTDTATGAITATGTSTESWGTFYTDTATGTTTATGTGTDTYQPPTAFHAKSAPSPRHQRHRRHHQPSPASDSHPKP